MHSARGALDGEWCRSIGLSPERVAGQRPVYRAVARLVEEAIGRGVLEPGRRLPPERALAAWLGVSRTTIVQAYRELESRGLLRGYVGRGTFVAAAPESDGAPFAWRGKVASTVLRSRETHLRDLMREAAEPGMLSIAAGCPALDMFPADLVERATAQVLRSRGAQVWGHGPTEGQPALRECLAGRHGGPAGRVLVLSGAQQGLDLLARCLVDPGDVVIIDRPGYIGAIHSFREAGARLHGWDVTRGDLDELEDLLLRYRPKLIYTNPTFHNPTGWTMPTRMRKDLLNVAGRYRVPIVEDGTYEELAFEQTAPPSLRSLDNQSIVIHLSSFSKVLAPGLRLGWLSASPAIVEHLSLIKQRADPATQNLAQLVVADLIDSGVYDAHLVRLRAEHQRRAALVTSAIERHLPRHVLRLSPRPGGGLYLWGRLEQGNDARAVLPQAQARQVTFVPGDAFYADRAGAHELRICFPTILPANADEFARRLAASVAAAVPRRVVRGTLAARG